MEGSRPTIIVSDEKLSEAIEHLQELLDSADTLECEECRREHEELLYMLVELQARRREDGSAFLR